MSDTPTPERCKVNNGTYACQLDAGHIGPHTSHKIERDSRNAATGAVSYFWTDAYSALTTRRRTFDVETNA